MFDVCEFEFDAEIKMFASSTQSFVKHAKEYVLKISIQNAGHEPQIIFFVYKSPDMRLALDNTKALHQDC